MLTRSAIELESLVLGHFTESMRAKLKVKEDWNKIDDKINSVDILKMIKYISFKVNTGKTFT